MIYSRNTPLFSLSMLTRVLGVIGLLAMTSNAHATDTSIKQALSKCAQQTNSLQRLVCYDRISAQLNDYRDETSISVVVPPSTTAPVAPMPVKSMPVKPMPEMSSPVEQTKPAQAKDDASFGKVVKTDDVMISTIASVKTGRNNLMTITLNNGQVWQQTKSEDRARFTEQQSVTIEKGFFGSFYLSAEGSNRRVAVKRLK